MKRILCLGVICLVWFAGLIYAQTNRNARDYIDVDLSSLNIYERITEKPHEMHNLTLTSCLPAGTISETPHAPPGRSKAFCHVYVSKGAKQTILSGRGTYPIGSIVIKSKLENEESKEALLYTVMVKMDESYDPKHGNWRYEVFDGTGRQRLASGRIDSCIDCHDEYRETDFVTRTYLKK